MQLHQAGNHGFNTSLASGAKRAADANDVDIREYEVIYKLLEDIQLAMEGLLEPDLVEESLGKAGSSNFRSWQRSYRRLPYTNWQITKELFA